MLPWTDVLSPVSFRRFTALAGLRGRAFRPFNADLVPEMRKGPAREAWPTPPQGWAPFFRRGTKKLVPALETYRQSISGRGKCSGRPDQPQRDATDAFGPSLLPLLHVQQPEPSRAGAATARGAGAAPAPSTRRGRARVTIAYSGRRSTPWTSTSRAKPTTAAKPPLAKSATDGDRW